MLLEKVSLQNLCPTIELSELRTELTHIHPVKRLETKDFCVKPLDFIEKQVCFINLDSQKENGLDVIFSDLQYIIDVEN